MRAKEALADLESISGHGNEYKDRGPFATSRGVMTRDFFDCNRADVVLVNFVGAKTVSIGTVMEIAWAYQKHTPVVVAMDDAPATVRPDDRAWLAALLDGEGSISISRRKGKSAPHYGGIIRLGMTHEGIVRRAQAVCGGLGSVYEGRTPKGASYWVWTVMSNDAAAVARDVFPYLVVKQNRAALLVEMQSLNTGDKNPSDALISARASVYDRCVRAQRGEGVSYTAPESPSSCHVHMMLNEAYGFVVPTLTEAINVAIAILS
jgi:hypothetical protein